MQAEGSTVAEVRLVGPKHTSHISVGGWADIPKLLRELTLLNSADPNTCSLKAMKIDQKVDIALPY